MLQLFCDSLLVQQFMALLAWVVFKIPGAKAPTKCPDQGFLPDDELKSGFLYSLISFLFYRVAQLFHGYEAIGLEKLPPKSEGCLLVSMHTTHNADIFTQGMMVCDRTGRAPRGLIHRRVFQFNPWVKYLGMVPGDRSTAVRLLQNGFIAACLPGGGEEAMAGHESAYTLGVRWGDRRGYAHVAKEAGVRIYPCFTQNCEEMRFNPAFWLGNRLHVGKAIDNLEQVPVLGRVVKNIALAMWFCLSFISLPVPVKLTTFIGDPIQTDGMSVDEIADATRSALQKLMDEKQPHGHAYLPGLKSHFSTREKID